jgi:uncharacterized protein (DUF1015 family)
MRQSPCPSTKVNAPLPDFLPFRGLRYAGVTDATAVAAPPYDVIDDDEREVLERADPHNAVRLILPQDESDATGGLDRYAAAAAMLSSWQHDGVLVVDDEPMFSAYQMTFDDPDGTRRTTTGVIGSMALPSKPGEGDVLPHERTLPKARSDRLALLRATRANLDPIWGLSLASGLTDAIGPLSNPITATDEHGAHHAMSPILDPGCAEMVRKLVASAPVVLADGHHRFETACTYRDERPDDDHGAAAIMTLIVELADEQLCVRPIHRLITDLDVPPAELRQRLVGAFDIEDVGANTPEGVDALTARMTEAAAIGFADSSGLALLRPKPDVIDARLAKLPAPLHDVDAARFDVAVKPEVEGATLGYRADAKTVAALAAKGKIDAAVLLRPVTVADIRAAAFAGVRMPEKTTFFHPKPRTGLVMRELDA